MPNTLVIDRYTNKLYHLSGQFTTTIKTSQSVLTWTTEPRGVSWDGVDTLFAGTGPNDKLYLLSGLFTSTLKTSQDVNSIDINPFNISSDNTNTPWCGIETDKLYLQSGKFTSTLKTSQGSLAGNRRPTGISWDNVNTPWCTNIPVKKLYVQSGQFSSTVKTSLSTVGGNEPSGISYSNGNTPWCIGSAPFVSDKLYLQSGQITSTIKTSQDISAITGFIQGIDVEPYGNRTGFNLSLTSALSLSQTVDHYKIHAINHGLTIGQFILLWGGAYNQEIKNYLSFLPFVQYDGNGEYTTMGRGLSQVIDQQFLPNRGQYNHLAMGQQINYSLIRVTGTAKSVQNDLVMDQDFELSWSLPSALSLTQIINGIAVKAPKSRLSVGQIISLQKTLNIPITTNLQVHSTLTYHVL